MEDANKSGKNAPEHANEPQEAHAPATNPNEEMGMCEGVLSEDAILTAVDYNEDLKARIEEEYGFEVIFYDELKEEIPTLALWMKELVRYGNVDSQVLIMRKRQEKTNRDQEMVMYRCWIYTEEHRYTFSAHMYPPPNKHDYLGGFMQTRKPRPGESWHRGNDLPDGQYCKDTFDRIVRGIVACEMKSLQLWRK